MAPESGVVFDGTHALDRSVKSLGLLQFNAIRHVPASNCATPADTRTLWTPSPPRDHWNRAGRGTGKQRCHSPIDRNHSSGPGRRLRLGTCPIRSRDAYASTMSNVVSRLDRITVDPSICHGAPTIRGMRLRVHDVLELLASGMTYEEILTDYDELERDDILAVLEFAALDSAGRRQRVVA
ncbi:DUF433 domain-containing protein [Pseudactinotalea sp. HY160]|nr:DUF433 domain-containing protein [Pseudactinotalea sp. HY160]